MTDGNLRLADIKKRGAKQKDKLLAVRIPETLHNRIKKMMEGYDTKKCEFVIALLNEGCDMLEKERGRKSA